MSKAEDIALSKFPVLKTELGDINYLPRISFIEGYHQAEKDLELTWEYQLNLRLPDTLDYNGIKVDREDFIKDIMQQIKS